MKKHFTIFSISCLMSFASFAQITITQSDAPSAGDRIISASDTVTAVSPGPSGAGQTWNFSNVLNQGQDTTDFINPSTTPYASSFPLSNLATRGIMPPDTNYAYYKSSATEFNVQGVRQVINAVPIIVVFNPSQKIITFPSNYLTSFTTSLNYDISFPFNSPPLDSLRAKHTETDYSIIDAWGNVTTPTSTYNSLRQKYITDQIDSVWIHYFGSWTFYSETLTKDTSYRWWANGEKYAVLEMSFDTAQASLSYLVSSGLTGINEQTASATASVFPNPSTDAITISSNCEQEKRVTIFDNNGKLIAENRYSGKVVTLNVAGYSKGIYFFEVLDVNSGKLAKGKFIIQ